VRIAIVGTRGIPARYGGFETFAEQLSRRLVRRGHRVTVFGRTSSFPYRHAEPVDGVHRVETWTWFGKHVETPLASLSAFFYLLFHRVDVILLCNAANSIFAVLPWCLGTPLVINVDGVERKRTKWGLAGKWWYRIGEIASLLFGRRVVADAFSIADYYADEYGVALDRIAYGANLSEEGGENEEDVSVLEEFGLTRGEYILYVSRLEPENNALGVVQAYVASGAEIPLVIVGDAPYATEYIRAVHDAANEGVIFTGYQFGQRYRTLQRHCRFYIQATEVGGTHPALIESMAFGNPILANGVPEHFEALGGAGVYYPRNDFGRLAELIAYFVDQKEIGAEFGALAKDRASAFFHWDRITDDYEELFAKCL
jgi:glycosyltransferase involved in cell wall biosynthesis